VKNLRILNNVHYKVTPEETQLYTLWDEFDYKTLYTKTWDFKLAENIDIERLSEGLRLLVRNNKSLRTNFHRRNGVVEKSFQQKEAKICLYKASETSIDILISSLKLHEFDLNDECLIQFHLIHNDDNQVEHLIVNSHHIATSGWTRNLILFQLMNYYYGGNKMTELEKEILVVWQEVFDYADISISDSFNELGGDSIKAIQIVSQLRDKGIKIVSQDLFELSTVRQLAKKITAEAEQETLDQSKFLDKIDLMKFEAAGKGRRFHEKIAEVV